MKHLVKIQNNDLVVSIQDMADFSKNDYESVQKLIRENKDSFKELGLNLPENGRGSSDFKSVLLNEPQATFLMTLMRNSDIVTRFKLDLVMDFYRMREQLCEVNRIQLETAQNEINQLQVKRLKTYRDGFMSLRKYLKENDIKITEDTAWSMLISQGVVENRDVIVSKKFLIDETLGRQTNDSGIEFNSRALDSIFSDYVTVEPTLF